MLTKYSKNMFVIGIILFSLLFSIGHGNEFGKGKRKTTCKVHQQDQYGSGSKYDEVIKLEKAIDDTFRGEIIKLKTENVLRIKFDVDYLNATFENQTITLFTSDRFGNYERDAERKTINPEINVEMNMDCTEDGYTTKHIVQRVTDINNHFPKFNQKSYQYSFGMTIPKGLDLTDIIPIEVTDVDISNNNINVEMEQNDDFKFKRSKYSYTLVAVKEIKAPFNKTYVITATDEGKPSKTTKVSVTVAVKNATEMKTVSVAELLSNAPHPPIFSQHIYFADYTRNHRLESEKIVIRTGAETSTRLKQKGLEEYFKVEFKHLDHKEVVVKKIRDLSKDIIEYLDVLVIEIEAVNEGFHVPGRTALIIRLPKFDEISFDPKGGTDYTEMAFGYHVNGFSAPLLLFSVGICSILFINAYAIILFIKKQKQNNNLIH